ncbi:MAG TPA: Na-translocating system protein MpsC family protein [Solirubrobacteraceae bacterium]|nr:Na-translocating system protein MpsC family protein [Solirubrobacteraceae bacterium]
MSADTDTGSNGNSLYSAISNTTVRLLREYTGRGPTKARTTIRDNVVLVMLEQTLTKGEQVLVNKGRTDNVLALRREWQEAMRDEISHDVAKFTGRTVLAMMSANHINPDLAAEIFVLDGPPNHKLDSAGPAANSQPPTERD